MSDPPMDDLATRLVRGDEAAFAELYDACADRLHRYVAVRLGSHDAADVVQSTFLRAVRSRRRFGQVENPVAYLFQIARNEAIRLAQHHRRRQADRLPVEDLLAVTSEPRDDADVMVAALRRLADDDRELVELKIFAGLTFREIAQIVGRPQGTVATRYRRALESLREWLTKQLQ